MDKLAIIVPAYNEEKQISSTIEDLKNNNYLNIILVDDGSKDKTSELAEEKGATVLKHIINRGQGAALQTGISYALLHNFEIIITFDADGQHQAKDIKALVQPLLEKKADIALGSRFIKENNIPISRKILLKGSILVDWFFSKIKLTDTHNGLRALSRKAAEKIEITERGMAHASEIIQQIKANKLRYCEVPITIRYTEDTLKKGHGSFSQAAKVLCRLIWNKIT